MDYLTISKLQGSDLIVDKSNEPNNFPEKLQEPLRITQGNGEELFAFIYPMLYYLVFTAELTGGRYLILNSF